MTYSDRNLCETVENGGRFETQRCTVPREKVTPLYHRLAAEDGDPSHVLDWAHEWDDHAGGLKGGSCVRCHKTLKEVRVRVGGTERRGHTSIAAAIARAARDVPPVRFTTDDANG